MPYLSFRDELRPLGPGVLTIGSGTEASWRIPNLDLAPLHAILMVERDGRASIAAGSASAPIVVNGVELDGGRGKLGFGDKLRLAGAEFTYQRTARAAPSDEAYLRDTKRGRVYKLLEKTQVGRDPRCVILLQEPEVSRVHAEIARRSGRFFVRPIGMAYVLLNTDRVQDEGELSEGDEITIGRTVLRFSAEPGPYRALDGPRDMFATGATGATGAGREAGAGGARGGGGGAVAGGSASTHSGGVRSFGAGGAAGPAHVPMDRRAARMQTVYMGAIEVRERLERGQRRRIAVIVIFILAAALLVFSLVSR
ncbi:MAG: FHA domain-containing protein [Gemmatimonadaceae bacterium]